MPAGVTGSLLPGSFLSEIWPRRFEAEVVEARRSLPDAALLRWWRRAKRALGPASSGRAILDIAALPLVDLLGYGIDHLEPWRDGFAGVLRHGHERPGVLIVLPWARTPDEATRLLQRAARTAGARWALVATGRSVHIVDASRTWTRRTLDFDLERVMADERAVLALWACARASAFSSSLSALVETADAHTVSVCDALGDGVLASLTSLMSAIAGCPQARCRAPHEQFEQSLTLVYRILFLLFAEARAVVPTWHHVYRESYTIDALCRRSTGRARLTGLWDALQAISRLAHAGCHAGDLRVTPFNGRLFSPNHTPLAERARIADGVVRDVVLALATVPTPAGRRRIAYGDLGVEQLGAVYERVLEYEPSHAADRAPALLTRTSQERKTTGAFYTPRSITEFLVRRTLHPLVDGRTAEQILQLRVVDPAMGSGAFLVAACRFLSRAAERARVASGEWTADDVTRERRIELRRMVAQRCLYGVDSNPTAVQLARLSLWLTTLASDRPLTFLDHHLACGDSLIGATFDDLARRPSASRAAAPTHRTLPLFESTTALEMASAVLPERFRIAEAPADTPEAVRGKERTLSALTAPGAPLHRWKAAADLWCAGWLWPDRGLTATVYGDLLAAILDRRAALRGAHANALLDRAAAIARQHRAFHWHLEFPEVFFDRDGRRRRDGGFDAVLGNPPWDVLRSDSGSSQERRAQRATQKGRHAFFRSAGVYAAQSAGHANCYQLFVERTLRLLRPGGRLGLILPSGLATDHGSAPLRRSLLDSVRVDRLFGFSNRERIFPIHRDVRFLLLTGATGAPTDRLTCRFGLRQASWLDTLPDAAVDDPPEARRIVLARAMLGRWDPERLAIPELESPRDLDILAHVNATVPSLSHKHGWAVRFGRELNATDDRGHFRARSGGRGWLPVIEGKHVEPFRACVDRATQAVAAAIAATLLDRDSTFDRDRIAYRDVASATNRLTLIAGLLPAGTVSTHTLFCLKTPLGIDRQYCLLGLLNSLAANYLVRLQMTTHVTVALMARLPVPKPPSDSPELRTLATLARTLEHTGIDDDHDSYARLNAIAARLYGLTRDQYLHVLSTFPLLQQGLRDRCAAEFG